VSFCWPSEPRRFSLVQFLPSATSLSCCCHPWSHFHAAVAALVAAASMNAAIWLWSRWTPGIHLATMPATQPAATAKTGVNRAANRPSMDPSDLDELFRAPGSRPVVEGLYVRVAYSVLARMTRYWPRLTRPKSKNEVVNTE
jgi:hypothetical protein